MADRPSLTGPALRALRAHAGRVAPVAAAFLALHVASDYASVFAAPRGEGAGALLLLQARGLAHHLAIGVLTGLSIRILLDRPAWRPIAGLAAYAALVAGAAFVQALPYLAVGNLRAFAAEAPAALVARLLAVSIPVIGLLLIYARLVLWPVGVLAGRAIGPAQAWARMRGTTLRFLGAAVMLAGLPAVAASALGLVFIRSHSAPAELAAACASTLVNLAVAAVTAEVFRAKVK